MFCDKETYQEYLTSCSVTSTPPDEVVGNNKGLLSLTSHVTTHHTQAKSLGRPKRQSDVVANEKANCSAEVCVGNSLVES